MSSTALARPISFSSLQRARESKRAFSEVGTWGLFFLSATIFIWMAGFGIGPVSSVSILTLLAFLATIAGIFFPVIGLFGIGLLSTLDAVTRHFLMTGGLLRWNTFNYWLLFILGIYSLRVFSLSYTPLRLLLAFSGMLLLQLVYSPDIMSGLQHWMALTTSLGILVYFIRGTKDPEVWIWFAIVNGVASGLGGLVFIRFQSSIAAINPNAYAYFPLTGLFAICLGYGFTRKSSTQLILQLLALLNIGWVFLTASRGSMLMAACCLFYLIISTKKVAPFIAMILIGLVLGAGVSSIFGSGEAHAIHRIEKMLSSDTTWAERTSGRSEIARAGWYMFLAHPLGVGTGGFRVKYAKISDKRLLTYGSGSEKAAHSGWIKVLAENGIFGFSLFFAYVMSFTYVGWQRRRLGVFALGLLVTLEFGTALLSTEFQGKGLWLLATGGLVILYRGYRQRPRKARSVQVEVDHSLKSNQQPA